MKRYILFLLLSLLIKQSVVSQSIPEVKNQWSFAVESGLHTDGVEFWGIDDGDDPDWFPEEFDPQIFLLGWSNRLKVSYSRKSKWSYSTRLGYTTFKRSYERAYRDVLGGFESKYFVERYWTFDFLIERHFVSQNDKHHFLAGIGYIFRFFNDSGYNYFIDPRPDGLYVVSLDAFSRNFADMGFSFSFNYYREINQELDVGISLNAYTLFYGYGLESVILAPFVNIKF